MTALHRLALATAAVAALGATPARASQYTDDMARCLVESTTPQDKTELVRWIFANAALHPEVASIAQVSAEQRTRMNRSAGALIERLLTVTCRKQTKDALMFDGPVALQMSFQVLGQVAMGSLMSHPSVGAGFTEFGKYVDEKKIRDLPASKD